MGSRLGWQFASPKFPLGHGKELCFWRLIVAVLILAWLGLAWLGLSGGISLDEGMPHVLYLEPLQDLT